MKEHLSSEQIGAWALGEREAEVEQHVNACAECRGELDGLGQTLAGFRNSVREWSASQPRVGAKAPRRSWQLAAACAACVLMLFAFVFQVQRSRVDAAAADAKLLQRVDSEVSKSVPQSMEPLLKLASWEPSSSQ